MITIYTLTDPDICHEMREWLDGGNITAYWKAGNFAEEMVEGETNHMTHKTGDMWEFYSEEDTLHFLLNFGDYQISKEDAMILALKNSENIWKTYD